MPDTLKETESDNTLFQSLIEDKTTEIVFIRPAPRLILSEDTLRLCLTNHITSVEKRNIWIPAFSNFFVILVTLITSNFKDFIVSKETWESMFVFAGIFTLVVSIYTFLRYAKNPKTIDEIIAELKGNK